MLFSQRKIRIFIIAVLAVCAASSAFTGCGKLVSEVSDTPSVPGTTDNTDNTLISENTTQFQDATDGLTEQGSDSNSSVGSSSNDPNAITGISLSMTEITLSKGQTKMPIVTMSPQSSAEKGEIWKSSDENVAVVDGIGNITAVGAGSCIVTVISEYTPEISADVSVTVTESPSETVSSSQSGNNLTYINGILVANKTYGLPADYNPGLDSETKIKFDELSAAAAKEGLNIYLSSGFRSYEYQKKIYSNYSSIYGSETADTFSARPGHSEHQTGLAIDVNTIDDSFAGTPEAIWLAEHAHEFGFIIRYPADKVAITGYKYEPWHIRYLGVETATAVYNSGLCLEEYLCIDSKYKE